METLTLTASQQRYLDTFFYRALRHILRIPSTFVSRFWTHERVLAQARRLARNPRRPDLGKGPTPFTEYYQKRRTKLLGHLLRSPEDSLSRAVVILPNGTDLALSLPKRVGRPRQTWLREAQLDALRLARNEGLEQEDPDLLLRLHELAGRRAHPFD